MKDAEPGGEGSPWPVSMMTGPGLMSSWLSADIVTPCGTLPSHETVPVLPAASSFMQTTLVSMTVQLTMTSSARSGGHSLVVGLTGLQLQGGRTPGFLTHVEAREREVSNSLPGRMTLKSRTPRPASPASAYPWAEQ